MMLNILNRGKWVGVVTANSARASSSGGYWREGGTQQLGWNISIGDNKKQDLCKFWRSTQHKKTLKFLRNYRQAHCMVVRMALKLCVYNSRTSGQFSESHQSHHFVWSSVHQTTSWLRCSLFNPALWHRVNKARFKAMETVNLQNRASENGFESLDVSWLIPWKLLLFVNFRDHIVPSWSTQEKFFCVVNITANFQLITV